LSAAALEQHGRVFGVIGVDYLFAGNVVLEHRPDGGQELDMGAGNSPDFTNFLKIYLT
jgi:hypothetical protein